LVEQIPPGVKNNGKSMSYASGIKATRSII